MNKTKERTHLRHHPAYRASRPIRPEDPSCFGGPRLDGIEVVTDAFGLERRAGEAGVNGSRSLAGG